MIWHQGPNGPSGELRWQTMMDGSTYILEPLDPPGAEMPRWRLTDETGAEVPTFRSGAKCGLNSAMELAAFALSRPRREVAK